MSNFVHTAVLLEESVQGLEIKPSGVYVDATLGGGGHAEQIAEKLDENGILVGIDRDLSAISAARKKLDKFSTFRAVHGRYENIKQIMQDLSLSKADGFLLDLGVSSHQLDEAERGFSYRFDAPLDMRMDRQTPVTAQHIINNYPVGELASIIKKFGEERYAKRIAANICKNRPINTTLELVDAIKAAVPTVFGVNPAMRTFQAIRIVVNDELTGLSRTISDMTELLNPEGHICIISFHSLEDRIVKHTFRELSAPCKCPKSLPYCVCGKEATLSIVTKKPIYPTEAELKANSRSHSAKLRIAKRLDWRIRNADSKKTQAKKTPETEGR
ncbi:MAG: 16S rRNA (cytosine(1402)-N(4))-methyltransferase RsmH [Turicibacter sp.]|nr:16S rRNA (cytosine(1402)-N(4))-methyltransferase RsmH [Turicibacter sp.]